MGASAGSFNGALPGLSLKAWAQVAANGTLIKSSNVTSVTKGAAGIYTLHFTTNMATATYIQRLTVHVVGNTSTPWSANVALGQTVSAMMYTVLGSGAGQDVGHFIEVYE